MKYMIAWKIPPGSYETTIKTFLETGAPTPDGLKTLGRWHVPGSVSGWHLVEGDDPAVVAQHVGNWSGVAELEVSAVVEDEEAANGLRQVYG